MSNIIIREIAETDNLSVAKMIRNILLEFGVPKVGTAYEDPQLNSLYDFYLPKTAQYFVLEKDGCVIGGAGISVLPGTEGNTCELQKMYFSPEARGKGLGKKMMDHCLQFAKDSGYEYCYLETLPYMEKAVKLYLSSGFKMLDERLGNTGHYSCSQWMIKKI